MSKALAIEPNTQSKQQRPMDGRAENIQEEIRVRAFELYEERGRADGYQEKDWYQAEKEILNQDTVARAA
jgi:hypothetical protein